MLFCLVNIYIYKLRLMVCLLVVLFMHAAGVDLSEVNTQNLTAYTKRQIREAIRGGQEIGIGGGGTVYSAHIDGEQVIIYIYVTCLV